MARQRIHNRRAARGSVGGGASWISYSDMMAALLLIFVLILTYSLSHYFTMLEEKNHLLSLNIQELEEKDLLLRQSMHELGHTTQELDLKNRDLDLKTQELEQTKTELNLQLQQIIILQSELDDQKEQLAASKEELESAQLILAAQQQAMQDQAMQIDALIGVRKTMISDLSASFARAGIEADVDENGNIVLNSSVFFESGKSTIRPEGQAFLDRFIPVYLSVLLRDEYQEYLGEIIIEGHTDSTGTYQSNLKLSQQRALEVALYCLNMQGLTPAQKNMLENILTAKGRSESDLKMTTNEYGQLVEDPDASRRVEFKFSLKDAQMIQDMSNLLKQQNLGD